MFEQLSRRLTVASRLLSELFADPSRLEYFVAAIKVVEHEADTITHDIISRIDKSFVTPIDREDIHLLASRLVHRSVAEKPRVGPKQRRVLLEN